MAKYADPIMWDDRYSTQVNFSTKQIKLFEWYQQYSGLKEILIQSIKPTNRILNVGAGNSKLTEEMYADGYQSIVNIDISPIVVKYMEERYKVKCPLLQYKVMDVLEMKEFKNGEFDVVIDKATFDSIICHDQSQKQAEIMLTEIYRVLCSTGVYICVSHGSEEIRKEFFKNYDWDIKVDKVVKPSNLITSKINDENSARNFHYVYTLTKCNK